MKRLLLTSLFLIGCGSGGESVELVDQVESVEPPVKQIEMVSHRGINAQDNTIEAFQNAINLGFDSVEMDIRLFNGEVVMAHDKQSSGVDYDYFSDALILAGNANVKIWIEAKEREAIKPMVELLNHYGVTNYIFTAYYQEWIDEFRALNNEAKTGLIVTDINKIETLNTDWVLVDKKLLPINTDKKIAVWTIKQSEEYDMYNDMVDAFISDIER